MFGKGKVKVIHFGTNRFFIYDFSKAVNSNFRSRAHRLATIHTSPLHICDFVLGVLGSFACNLSTHLTLCRRDHYLSQCISCHFCSHLNVWTIGWF